MTLRKAVSIVVQRVVTPEMEPHFSAEVWVAPWARKIPGPELVTEIQRAANVAIAKVRENGGTVG